tara:strand:- start:667 stop:807 length:141 start_codon:yes stop_codon:yes gene_type:complete
MAMGAAPKQPPRKRETITVAMLGAVATGIWKMVKRKKPRKRGWVRP